MRRGGDDYTCDQPLCASEPADRARICGRRLPSGAECSAPARWRCSRRNHDAMCGGCLRRAQRLLIGAPGPRASTDIYDAVVERETVRLDGVVYLLSGVASRKPPKIPPNWLTTYWLKCSALVALVRLGVAREPLEEQRPREWAEVVPIFVQGGYDDDSNARSQGRIALRLLGRADLSTLARNADAMEQGTKVAIIDLQVFVPQVLSVLSTVSDPSLVDHLKEISFSGVLIGAAPPVSLGVVDDPGCDPVCNALSIALEKSAIDVVTRLPDGVRADLLSELVRLAQDANLYGTQLEAFSAALCSSLHCTQGPPGTGKSYIGVVLIRARNIIKKYAQLAGIALGPIVVLSYKNHALGEILMGVIEREPRATGRPGLLIRCGKPENQNLLSFTERSTVSERLAADKLSTRVTCKRTV